MSSFVTRGVVAWADTDASGRFHYTAPYRWAENAEHALYRSVLSDLDLRHFPRRATLATYERPLSAGDKYSVELDVTKMGRTSITYEWRVLGPDGVSVSGNHVVVHVDDAGRSSALPEQLRQQLATAPDGNS